MDDAGRFIDKNWPRGKVGEPLDMNSVITYAVSTTLNSTVLLIAKGIRNSMFTRNTYSADPENPWLIYQDGKENKALAQYIQESWNRMAIHANGNREEVNKIAPHVLFHKVGDNFVLVPLPEADEKNVVRFHVNDIEIWSHPPRDDALTRALRDDEQFKQAEGKLKTLGERWNDIRNNPNIPTDRKEEALKQKRHAIKMEFLNIYGFYERLVPNSYKWPTLQLGQRTETRQESQHYGATYAGVYGPFANEVHNIFAASNVEARPLPTQETVYYSLLPDEQFALSFKQMMQDDQ